MISVPLGVHLLSAVFFGFFSPNEVYKGSWDVYDSHFADSNISYTHIGKLIISDSMYQFFPEQNAFISPEMTERFLFIQNTQGSLSIEFHEDVESTAPSHGNTIVGTICFDHGETFLIRKDMESGELSISSAVSEIELFRIAK